MHEKISQSVGRQTRAIIIETGLGRRKTVYRIVMATGAVLFSCVVLYGFFHLFSVL